jgi:hypothetical protein
MASALLKKRWKMKEDQWYKMMLLSSIFTGKIVSVFLMSK